MNCSDVIAYTCDGAAYCPDCIDHDEENEEIGVVFADQSEEIQGWTCDACSCCYIGGEWVSHEDAVNREYTRWAVCEKCNHNHPYAVSEWEYHRARYDSFIGQLQCPDCRQGRMHF